MLQKIKSLSLERQLFLSFSAVSALLLMLSLGITLYFDIARQSQSIDSTISSTAAYVASMDGGDAGEWLSHPGGHRVAGFPAPEFSWH